MPKVALVTLLVTTKANPALESFLLKSKHLAGGVKLALIGNILVNQSGF
jgi:hypothetical protein